MATVSICLGKNEEQLKILFAYPNIPDQDNTGSQESLVDTIMHWFGQTLGRDGLVQGEHHASAGSTTGGIPPESWDVSGVASIRNSGEDYYLDLDLPDISTETIALYTERLPKILDLGWQAWEGPVKTIKTSKVWGRDKKSGDQLYPMWDPNDTGEWRFFLTLGVGVANHRTLQFFHYPPERLLNPLRDSMQDPVTYRCRDLLEANDVDAKDTRYYETRINSTPIAAPDNQGTNVTAPANPVWGGLIPVGYFRDFERDMIRTLIKPHANYPGYTIPMTAYGKDPRQRFGGMFLDPDKAMVLEVVEGLKTPVLGSNHPYNFFYQAQASDGVSKVGSGKMIDNDKVRERCTQLQQDDLAVARWQTEMAKNPSQDPWQLIKESQEHWKAEAQQKLVQALVLRHASLTYKTDAGIDFWFALSLDDAKKKVGL